MLNCQRVLILTLLIILYMCSQTKQIEPPNIRSTLIFTMFHMLRSRRKHREYYIFFYFSGIHNHWDMASASRSIFFGLLCQFFEWFRVRVQNGYSNTQYMNLPNMDSSVVYLVCTKTHVCLCSSFYLP